MAVEPLPGKSSMSFIVCSFEMNLKSVHPLPSHLPSLFFLVLFKLSFHCAMSLWSRRSRWGRPAQRLSATLLFSIRHLYDLNELWHHGLRCSNGLWHHCGCVYWLKHWQPSGSWNRIPIQSRGRLNGISSSRWLAGCLVTWLAQKQFDVNEICPYWCLIKSHQECVRLQTRTHTLFS